MAGFFPPALADLDSKDFFSKDNSTVVTLLTLLLRHVQSCSCNAYEIDELVRQEEHGFAEATNIGGAVYSTVSLSNHSCAPNSIRYTALKCIISKNKVYDPLTYRDSLNHHTCSKNICIVKICRKLKSFVTNLLIQSVINY